MEPTWPVSAVMARDPLVLLGRFFLFWQLIPTDGQLLRVQQTVVSLFRQQPHAAVDLCLGDQIQLSQAPGIALLRRYTGRTRQTLDVPRHLCPPQGPPASGDEHRPCRQPLPAAIG